MPVKRNASCVDARRVLRIDGLANRARDKLCLLLQLLATTALNSNEFPNTPSICKSLPVRAVRFVAKDQSLLSLCAVANATVYGILREENEKPAELRFSRSESISNITRLAWRFSTSCKARIVWLPINGTSMSLSSVLRLNVARPRLAKRMAEKLWKILCLL